MTTFRTRTRRGAAVLFTGVLVLGGLTLTGAAADAETPVEGNPTCEGWDHGDKLDSPTAGEHTLGGDGVTMTFTVITYPDQTDPNTNNAIDPYKVEGTTDYQIIVKGASGANIYEPGDAAPLHAPANSSGKWPTISHVDLCWNDAPPPPPPPPPPPETGDLEVTKVVTGDGVPTVADTYEICITGPDLDTTKTCQTITGAGVLTFADLELGTYTVSETVPAGAAFTATITVGTEVTPTVVITGNADVSATVTNTYTPPTPPPTPPPAPTPPETPTPTETPEVVPEVESLPPAAPVTPTTPTTPTVTAAPTALPTTGSEVGLAIVATILVATGVALTLVGRRRGTQPA